MKKLLLVIAIALSLVQTGSPALPKIRQMGFYTHFIQPADWSVVGDKLIEAKYNSYSIHATSTWGALDGYWPWVFDPATKKFDLSKSNPVYWLNVDEFLQELAGKRHIRIEVALFDFYYQDNYIPKGASKYHPFRNNKQGFDWSDNTDALGASVPWFVHYYWTTKGTGLQERVDTYGCKLKYKWLQRYVQGWGKAIRKLNDKYPGAAPVMIRWANEQFTRYRATGELQKKEGGEDKLYQIVVKEFEKLGLVYGKDFLLVDDHMIFVGNEFLPYSTSINGHHITGWAPGGRFDRQPDLLYWREVHITTPEEIPLPGEMSDRYPRSAHTNYTVVSNDSWKPEDRTYIKWMLKLFRTDYRIVEIKVPSEREVTQSLLLKPEDRDKFIDYKDFMKKFMASLEVMKRIAQ